ncbi:MAG: hypothetical protein WDZ59_01745 [Pirellulales bacterium]
MEFRRNRTTGRLVICIDLPSSVQQRASAQSSQQSTVKWLMGALSRVGLPATWAVDEPAGSWIASALATSNVPHEIALLGEASWVGSRVGRSRFARELGRRVLAARSTGLGLSSLVPRGTWVDDHLDLLLKYGITAVRGMLDEAGRSRIPAAPHALHFGLWEVPGSISLPGGSTWMPGGGRGAHARRVVRRAALQGHTVQVVIDLPRLANGGDAARRVVESVLRHAARWCEEESLTVETLAGLAAQLSHTPQAVPSRSILRKAG